MIPPRPPRRPAPTAFTLIELLVVMAIITVLAGLAFTAIKGIKESATRRKVTAELQRLETAIESYKARFNVYPPDNPGNPALNPLYFELLGTEQVAPGVFRTLDGGARITAADLNTLFGGKVTGFVNFTRDKSGEGQTAVNFFAKAGLPPSAIGAFQIGSSDIRLLVCSVQWPANLGDILPGHPGLNPWRYNSSSPTNNPASYDLWVDVIIGGKTNRISNWSEKPQIFK
jgi:prepilin-type N-terminal cleavage/methylation domain-containing protein